MQDVLEKDPLSAQIAAMRDEQKTLRDQRNNLAKELKLAERKKSRLRRRARLLTDDELVNVLMMRKEAKAAAGSEGPPAGPAAAPPDLLPASAAMGENAEGTSLEDEER